MRIAATRPLFARDALEDSPSLRTVREFLEGLPDAKLLAALDRWRGRGRDDYPVHVLWGVQVLTVLLRHPSTAACLAELKRNPPLRRLIGIDAEGQVPRGYNLSRFQQVLGREPHLSLARAIFDAKVQQLGLAAPDLGAALAGDATGLSARPAPARPAKRLRGQKRFAPTGEAPVKPPSTLPAPSRGHKEYTDAEGKVERVVEWFGYKLHQLVDTRHEVAVAWRVSAANVGDHEELAGLLAQAQANLPPGRIRTLAY